MNLVGYCAEKGQHMLLYAFMPNGSLASHLYGIYYLHMIACYTFLKEPVPSVFFFFGFLNILFMV